MRTSNLLFALLVLVGSRVACADGGGLGPETIEALQSSFEMDAHTRAMYNAITNANITDLALNRDLLRRHNDLYSHKVDVKGVTNQGSSGRCWLFAGLNQIRHRVRQRQGLKDLEFSQVYLTFWDKLEKSNTFLEYIIRFRNRDLMNRELVMVLKDPCPDGGYWENVVDLVNKYGLVPKDVYPETNSSNATRSMNGVLAQLLRADAVRLRHMSEDGASLRQLRERKEEMLQDVYRILAINLGEPPTQFTWRYEPGKSDKKEQEVHDGDDADDKEDDDAENDEDGKRDDDSPTRQDIEELVMTPRGFFREFVDVDMGQWVNLFNDPTHPVGRHYTIRMSRNVADGQDIHYANIAIDTLKEIAIRSLLDGTPVMFACNVSVDQSGELGIMADGLYDYDSIYGIDMRMSKAELALYRNGTRNHGMVFVGVDLHEGRPVKWRVENSWGTDRGKGGYWALYDGWFDQHVYNIIALKKYVPEDVLQVFEQKPEVLPPWDPML